MTVIQNNSINNKTFVYHLANTFKGSESLCKIVLFLFVHNIHKAIAVIGDNTLDPTVRKYYADRLVKRELVYIAFRRNYSSRLANKIRSIAGTITSSGNTLIKDWLIKDYKRYSAKKARYEYRITDESHMHEHDTMTGFTNSYLPDGARLEQAKKEYVNDRMGGYHKYTPNGFLKKALGQDFLNTLKNDPSLHKDITDALSKLK